jgi:hypothetical protein
MAFEKYLRSKAIQADIASARDRVGHALSTYTVCMQHNNQKSCFDKSVPKVVSVTAIERKMIFLTTDRTLEIMNSLNESLLITLGLELLQKLPIAKAAFYESPKESCLHGTRVTLLQKLQYDLGDKRLRIVWLEGSPGRGKSAIAKSLCLKLLSEKIPVVSFFFNRNGADDEYTTTTKRFSTTIARQLVRFSSQFRQQLVELDLDEISKLCDRKTQLRDLVIGPAQEVRTSWPARVVIVIDALDECGDLYALERLMELVEMLFTLPHAFVIFISCRHVTPVDEFFKRLSNEVRTQHSLDHIDNAGTEDLRVYVRSNLTNIPRTARSGRWPPETSRIDEFAAACGGLFEIASVRIRQVRDERHLLLIEVFDHILKYPRDPTPTLEKEYRRIINSSYIDKLSDDTARSDPHALDRYHIAYQRYRLFTAILITVLNPFTLPELASLLQRGEDEILAILQHLSPVMVVGDDNTPFRFYHASFPEFLHSNDGGSISKSFPICFDGPQHVEVLKQCFKNFQNSDYGKTMWITHLERSTANEALRAFAFLKSFLQQDVILWLESLNNSDAHSKYNHT